MGDIIGVIKTRQLNESGYWTIVLVKGAVGDYAAYEGNGTSDWVVDYGRKLTFKEAKLHFSWITSDKYRR